MSIFLILFAVLLVVPLVFLSYKIPEGPNRFGVSGPSVHFTDAVRRFFSSCFNFKGRASRTEYWYAMLFYAAASFLFGLFDAPEILFSLWTLGTVVPVLSVSARRLHDTNRSGWLQIVSWFAPVGTIIAIFWFSKPPSD